MRLGGPQRRSGQVRKFSPPPGFDPRTVQPIASRYNDWATRPTLRTVPYNNCTASSPTPQHATWQCNVAMPTPFIPWLVPPFTICISLHTTWRSSNIHSPITFSYRWDYITWSNFSGRWCHFRIVAGLFNPGKQKGCWLSLRYYTCFPENSFYLNRMIYKLHFSPI
jgi:hypothetical protein